MCKEIGINCFSSVITKLHGKDILMVQICVFPWWDSLKNNALHYPTLPLQHIDVCSYTFLQTALKNIEGREMCKICLCNIVCRCEKQHFVASKYCLFFIFPNRATVNLLMLKPPRNLRWWIQSSQCFMGLPRLTQLCTSVPTTTNNQEWILTSLPCMPTSPGI